MATILDGLKVKYKEWKKIKDEEGKAYKDALHEARMSELKKKAVTDAHEQVFAKKKSTQVQGKAPVQGFINSFSLSQGEPIMKTKNKVKSEDKPKGTNYLSEEIFGPQKAKDIKDENNNDNKYNWRF